MPKNTLASALTLETLLANIHAGRLKRRDYSEEEEIVWSHQFCDNSN